MIYCVQDLLQLAKELIGKTIYVGWPYLNEAMVHSISDGAVQYYQVREVHVTACHRSQFSWLRPSM